MLPSLPTDNLYKFLALSGVALIISSGYYYAIFADQYLTDLNTLYKEGERMEIELKFRNEDRQQRIKKMKELVEKNEAYDRDIKKYVRPNIDDDKTEILYNFKYYKPVDLGAYLKKKMEANEEEFFKVVDQPFNDRQFNELNIEQKYRIKLVAQKEKNLRNIKGLAISGWVLGLILMSFGFIKWYQLQQVYDKNIKAT